MEHYIKKNMNDITYKSELIPLSCFRKKAGGIKFADGFAYNLCHCHSISCLLI
jgi:hypothetical protein